MENIWIIGAGRFGKIAIERLAAQKSDRSFLVVDTNAGHLSAEVHPRVTVIEADGSAFLKRTLSRQKGPEWIIPALPVHLAAQWCLGQWADIQVQRCTPPGGIESFLPNLLCGVSGDLYVSMATVQCPDNCPEPADFCPVTGEKRLENMFNKIRQMKIPGFEVLLIQSRQLAPGVGGYRPEDLFQLRRRLAEKTGEFLVATACRCHGVITPVTASGNQGM
ncbi:MAG: potassium transporter [Desulfobacterales bacterium]|nr:potassium transporter [Desulfobacterales bacterium]MBS3754304.1 potassium transporter [Desulfobacterales bacterium]